MSITLNEVEITENPLCGRYLAMFKDGEFAVLLRSRHEDPDDRGWSTDRPGDTDQCYQFFPNQHNPIVKLFDLDSARI